MKPEPRRAIPLAKQLEASKRQMLSAPAIGAVFSRWTVNDEARRNNARLVCQCQCACGIRREVRVESLISGKSTSCGCHKNEQFAKNHNDRTIHGMSNSAEHKVWLGMLSRCENPKSKSYADYGARGICVCPRWKYGEDGKNGFECFYKDVGARPSPMHTLERKSNDKSYSPDNVIWATRKEQNRNTRRNHIIVFRGEAVPISVAVERWSLAPAKCVYSRLRRGWTVERALLTPSGEAR